jgi:hypothetical protein
MSREAKPQHLQIAQERAFSLAARQSAEKLQWLGAEFRDDAWHLPVLNETFRVDLQECRITTLDGIGVGLSWGILALHYFAITSYPSFASPRSRLPTSAQLGRMQGFTTSESLGVYAAPSVGTSPSCVWPPRR